MWVTWIYSLAAARAPARQFQVFEEYLVHIVGIMLVDMEDKVRHLSFDAFPDIRGNLDYSKPVAENGGEYDQYSVYFGIKYVC